LAGVAAPEIAIRWAASEHDLQGAFAVRDQVFCVEQGVPREEEIDPLDAHASHLVAVIIGPGDRADQQQPVIGTLRLLSMTGMARVGEAKIGRVAVAADWRRRGIASQMLAAALARAREEGFHRVRLAAQVAAVALYEQAGFSVESDEPFDDAGIPHVWMAQQLSPAHTPPG
jgi:predicted GNAT family N-acyltransferase